MLTKLGLTLALLGFSSLALFKVIGSSVDENGVLREPFGLLPIGFGLLLLGLLTLAAALVKVACRRWLAGKHAA